MKIPTIVLLLLSMIPTIVVTLQQQQVCPFKVLIWETDPSCSGPPDSVSELLPNGECQENSAISGPGNYKAYCDTSSDNTIVFSASGCKEECPAASSATDDDFSTILPLTTCELASRTASVAQQWYGVDPVNNYSPPLEAHILDPSIQLASFVCYRIFDEERSSGAATSVFSYALFGDCSDTTSCSSTPAEAVDEAVENTTSGSNQALSTSMASLMTMAGAGLILLG